PDSNLANYVAQKTGKNVVPIPTNGFCPTHILFQPEDARVLKMEHPHAVVMAHPECSRELRQVADFIGSTSKMCCFAKKSTAKEFIIGTEEGIIHRLRKENPNKKFYIVYEGAICPNMKLTTLERVYTALKDEKNVITVPEEIAKKAYASLERMFKVK
ncbi:MAG: quinolinate synthase NadA, partial [Crenarchaeota archaeon]|nr:quinolinate synthase NadA [Thermoproteota archaeon]